LKKMVSNLSVATFISILQTARKHLSGKVSVESFHIQVIICCNLLIFRVQLLYKSITINYPGYQ
jgi:hypothetical protein